MKYLSIFIFILATSCLNNSTDEKSEVKFLEQIALIEENFNHSKVDSLSKELIGTTIPNLKFIDVNGKTLDLSNGTKPIFLQATASWCKPCKALIPILNKLVEEYHDQIDFLLLTHDTQEKAEILSKTLHPKIRLIPSKSKRNPNSLNKIDVEGFKQIFPFPTCYMINSDKIVTNVLVGAATLTNDSPKELTRTEVFNTQSLLNLIGRDYKIER